MKNTIIYSALVAALLSGCAKRADSVVPVSIPIATFAGSGCVSLGREFNTELANVAALTKQQNQAAAGDAIGVLLIGVPTASITGYDREAKLAVSKGKLLSLENAMRAKSCERPVVVTTVG